MSLACIYSRARVGLESPLVTVEVHLANGLPAFNIVGLPETSVRESKDRVRSAIINCGYEFPAKRITINLAPADLPKEGGRFDLPIAIGFNMGEDLARKLGLRSLKEQFHGDPAPVARARRSTATALPSDCYDMPALEPMPFCPAGVCLGLRCRLRRERLGMGLR